MDSNLPSGFEKVTTRQLKDRLVIALSGLEKTGKTHWCLTAPEPIAYFDFDRRGSAALDKFRAMKTIYHKHYDLPNITLTGEADKKRCEKLLKEFKSDWEEVMGNDIIRTVVVDTCSDVWELIRLAHFGKLTKVMPHMYVTANADFRVLFKTVYSSDKNVIFVSKLKEEYKNDSKTGDYELSTMKDLPYIVEVNARTVTDKKDLGIEIISNGVNLDLKGETLWDSNGQFDFLSLATLSLPEAPMEAWI